MDNDYDELVKVFNEVYVEIMKDNETNKSANEILDARVNKLLD